MVLPYLWSTKDLRNINNNFEIMGPEDFNNKNTKPVLLWKIRVWNKTLKMGSKKRIRYGLQTIVELDDILAKLINKYLRGFFDYLARWNSWIRNKTNKGDLKLNIWICK